jgi:hypothetical protein
MDDAARTTTASNADTPQNVTGSYGEILGREPRTLRSYFAEIAGNA